MTKATHTQRKDNEAIIEAARKKIVAFTYTSLDGVKPKKIDRDTFLKLAKEVGKNPIDDDLASTRPIPAGS